MEELLNKLIEKGWKPRWEETYKPRKRNSKYITYVDNYKVWYYVLFENLQIQREYTKRELVSKESWLWQFVCENGMLNKKRWSNRVRLETSSVWNYIEIWTGENYGWKFDNDYEYRLIETSLKNEDELEQFLLENIKVE